ncbi:arabinan endo-1,5-alpha-L-arabinosidase [Blastopirellula retiformator]|uniref:Intracellular endo-alpha-(1->5)-L-arabinanase n=1 Tax=Blastopirellula retiformator TaxID=2527970 RepID=A0A5C5V8J1_9BACT|nr:arabinan endo-1,5-alpha-L-arabinosidase [Blastopirellula retiformator]TWT34601.1 Intracellular endo-alpha-(1->5)-L-arabinanase [Blastopirellula retiformator]
MSSVSAIALASNPTLDPDDPHYRWTDEGIVVRSHRGDNFNAIDPAVIRTDDGQLWMTFGSFWSGIQLIQLDPQTGLRLDGDKTMRTIASTKEIEAPHLYQHDGWYYLRVNWGKCCRGVESTYNIRVGRSRTITSPYLDQEGVDLAQGGGTLLLETNAPFIGPGHANILEQGDDYISSAATFTTAHSGNDRCWRSRSWCGARVVGQR